ncbi:hypothetical protein C8A00DRAFT_13569 [Chaetomidium leptoderma]|uniref:Uncharacterized protein n=1 Tax=Chaetomidium leptoderma TaxID=669021 RepID=A0AAN6VQ89_9PEZI|nr:hypothetical protein C8A00DRAFT_13569 [Chaetomidium leptoderma]
MELLTFLLLCTVLAPVSSSPIVPPGDAERNEPLMKPALGRREALNLGSPPDLSPLDTAVLQPLKGCTTTLSETYGYPCSWDGTTTVYPSTTVLFQQINCNGCETVYVDKELYYCPNQSINGTQKMAVPTTSWSTICRPSSAVARRAQNDAPATTVVSHHDSGVNGGRSPEDYLHPAACPTTLVVQPERSAGKTSTEYSSWTTSTMSLSCGGCPLVVSTALVGYGPPGSFVTTTTLPVGTITTYACR